MPASRIGPTDIGYADNGIIQKKMASRTEASHDTADRTWKSSQGIRFQMPSRSRTWWFSQGIKFSNLMPSSGSPWSADYGNSGTRALSTSAGRETSPTLGVPTSDVSNRSPLSSSTQERSIASFRSSEQQVEDLTSRGERDATSKAELRSKSRSKAMPNSCSLTPREDTTRKFVVRRISESRSTVRQEIEETSVNIDSGADQLREPLDPSYRAFNLPVPESHRRHTGLTASEQDRPTTEIVKMSKDPTAATDCSDLDLTGSPEPSRLNFSTQSSLSDLKVGLSIRPTHSLAQQYMQSSVDSNLSTPDDILAMSFASADTSTTDSAFASSEKGSDSIVEEGDAASSASKADVTVQATKKPCEHHLSPLGYHIPEKRMADAKLASPGTSASYWQYVLYRGPNGEKIKVHYCKSKTTTEHVAQLFLGQEVLGFDIEWKPQALATEGVKKNVALIQLASEERIALFHVARYWEDEKSDDLLAPTLKKIMESTKITKVGVSIKADCTRLRKFMGIDSRSLLELSHLYKLVKFSPVNVKMINKKLVSLSQQVEEHLQLPMWKGEVRSSDWSQDLNYEQIYYAASDSYAGFQLYHVLEGKRKALDPPPPRPAYAELNLPIRLANGQTVATYDEEAEAAEEIVADLPPDPSISIEEMARDFLNVAVEDTPAPSNSQPRPIRSQSRSAAPPEVAAADEWVSQWRSTLPSDYKPRATTASLRAYALWHHQDFDVPNVAAMLRDPPLKEATVANYVLEAIRIEKLPHAGKEKLDMVIYHLNKNIQARYQRL